MSSKVTSEQLSIREGASYDEVFCLGHEPEDFSWSSERETSAQSPVTRSQTISQSVSLGKMKDATQGGLLTSACTMPCLLGD